MGIVTEAGFYDGEYLRSGEFRKAEVETVATGIGEPSKGGADLDAMTKDELLAEAKMRGVEVKAADSKAEILAALTKASKPAV